MTLRPVVVTIVLISMTLSWVAAVSDSLHSKVPRRERQKKSYNKTVLSSAHKTSLHSVSSLPSVSKLRGNVDSLLNLSKLTTTQVNTTLGTQKRKEGKRKRKRVKKVRLPKFAPYVSVINGSGVHVSSSSLQKFTPRPSPRRGHFPPLETVANTHWKQNVSFKSLPDFHHFHFPKTRKNKMIRNPSLYPQRHDSSQRPSIHHFPKIVNMTRTPPPRYHHDTAESGSIVANIHRYPAEPHPYNPQFPASEGDNFPYNPPQGGGGPPPGEGSYYNSPFQFPLFKPVPYFNLNPYLSPQQQQQPHPLPYYYTSQPSSSFFRPPSPYYRGLRLANWMKEAYGGNSGRSQSLIKDFLKSSLPLSTSALMLGTAAKLGAAGGAAATGALAAGGIGAGILATEIAAASLAVGTTLGIGTILAAPVLGVGVAGGVTGALSTLGLGVAANVAGTGALASLGGLGAMGLAAKLGTAGGLYAASSLMKDAFYDGGEGVGQRGPPPFPSPYQSQGGYPGGGWSYPQPRRPATSVRDQLMTNGYAMLRDLYSGFSGYRNQPQQVQNQNYWIGQRPPPPSSSTYDQYG